MKRFLCLTIVALPVVASAQSTDRFVEKVRLPEGETVLVAEGELEPRSIGSFSVRVYEAAGPKDETTFFVGGLIHPRDGTMERVALAEVDSTTASPEIVVVVRSVGTGGYLSAHAFSYRDEALAYIGSVAGLPADADAVAHLRTKLNPTLD